MAEYVLTSTNAEYSATAQRLGAGFIPKDANFHRNLVGLFTRPGIRSVVIMDDTLRHPYELALSDARVNGFIYDDPTFGVREMTALKYVEGWPDVFVIDAEMQRGRGNARRLDGDQVILELKGHESKLRKRDAPVGG